MRNVKKNREYVTKFETGFLLLLVVFTVFVRLQSTDIPLDRDEGAYAYIAAHLDEGMLPYKDTFDHKPPFIYYLYRTGFTMFGESAQGIRSFTTAYVVITLILLYMMVRTVTVSGFTAMLSALFYSMFINNNIFQGFGSNLEIFTHLPLLLSMFFALDRDKKYMKVSFFVSGFFAATAFFIKTMVAFAAVAPLVYILVMYRGNRLKASGWFIAGFASMSAAVFGWAAWNRMLPQFYECVFNYNFAYMKMRTEPLKTVLNGSYYFTILYLLPVISMAWFMVKSFLPKREDLPFLTVIAAIGSYAGVAALKGYYPHYFLTLIPYAALLGALFVRDIYAMLDGVLRLKYYAAAVVSLLLVLNAASYFVHSGTLQFVKSGRYSMDIFYQTRAISAAAKMALANSKGGKMFVFQNQPEVYFLAGGKAVSRYIYAYPLAIYGQAAAESFSREFIDGKPDVLVLEKGNYTAYETYVDNYYRKISETRNFEVFEKL